MQRSLFLLLLSVACRDKDAVESQPSDDSVPITIDEDGDGIPSEEDCDDSDADVRPGNKEFCDNKDNDCDGEVDNEALDGDTWYADADGDGYGVTAYSEVSCTQPTGYVADDGDCDDSDSSFHPGASEADCADPNDYNCDGSVGYSDNDADGYPACEDCEDNSAEIHPEALEVCDGLDNNCDGDADEDAVDASTWYIDLDGDGYGYAAYSTEECTQPVGYVENDEDCDDGDATLTPESVWYLDYDQDGYGDPARSIQICEQPSGYVDNGEDCADNDADVNPDLVWYADDDNDGYGDPKDSQTSCEQPSGHVGNASDCDDSAASLSPDTVWYLDFDKDGYAGSDYTVQQCTQPSGYYASATDCDDTSKSYSPGASEGCDGEDYNCDGSVDHDADGDGYADNSCGGDDCDDSDAAVVPEPGGGCALGADCAEVLAAGYTTDGTYSIDPDGYGTGEDPIDVYCDMTTSGGGWTLCASLTKGYVPNDMIYNADLYAFQARLNSDQDYVYETDAPARTTTMWDTSETLNYGQFCRLMGTGVSNTWVQAKMYVAANNYGASAKGKAYDATYSGVFTGNLFLQWFTNSSSARTFTHVSGDKLYVQSDNNGYGSAYITPNVGWSSSNYPYTQSTNPWNSVDSSSSCTGCTNNGSGYTSLPYGQTTILNNMSHSFWSGISNVRYGWTDCTSNGNCNYHESGYGVWLFWVR